jgi:DNA-binding transcriptional LysR family regulator
MNLNQLEALVEVIRTGSVAAAAHNLYLSAPAVTKQVKALERELNVKLFDKVGRNLVPRHEAQVVSRYALEVFRQVEQMRDELAAGDKQLRGGVSIGCGAFVARALLPPIVAICRR